MRALVELAALEGVADGRPVPVAEVARRRRIPRQSLEQVFAVLRRAGIVRSRRGAGGGYRFARPPHGVTVLDVVTALEGVPSPAPAAEPPAGSTDIDAADVVWAQAAQAVEAVLAGTTIADLVEREQAARRGPAMYHI